MSELFTTTPPSEEGWFWVQDRNEDIVLRYRIIENDNDAMWYDIMDESFSEDALIKIGYKFGPKVPSAKEYAELREKARKWDLLDANFVDCGNGVFCKLTGDSQ